ncbi:hypothetical protein CVT23_00025 [Minwuia thermotolerans]|uniref:non-specific protein-tyrosine kinase n=2 Tax=Minwuia thermotolerans TaxID=2056226 RepID=A0A2M9G7Q8_9PROT|nr:hypothetical protein CVT23_00025 [Minwuia thermotolerans]
MRRGTMTDTPPSAARVREVSLTDFIQYARRKYVKALLAGLVVFGVCLLVLSLRPPVYSAQTTLLYRPEQADFANVNLLASGMDVSSATINNEIEIIRSTDLLSRVVERTGLNRDPEFVTPAKLVDVDVLASVAGGIFRGGAFDWAGSALGWARAPRDVMPATRRMPAIDVVRAASALRGRIEVESERFSYAFTLSVSSTVPEKAAILANTVADAYIEDQLEAKFSETKRATNWLSDRIAELEARVRESESAAAQKRAEFSEISGRDAGTISQQIAQLSTQLVTAQSALTAARSRYEITSRRREQGEVVDSDGGQNSDTINRLIELRTDLRRREAELSGRYLEKHPKLIAVREDLAQVEARLQQARNASVGDARAELRAAEITVQNLSNELRRVERQAQDFRQAEVAIRQLEREAETDRNLYETYLSRLRETTAKEDVQTADVRVLQRASVPGGPVGVPPLLLAIAGGAGGGALWLCFGFAVGLLRQGFNHREEVEEVLGETVLAVVPEVAPRHLQRGVVEYLQREPDTGFAESFRKAKSVLALRSMMTNNAVICVTSSVPGEGKTTFASGLAYEFAKSKRCLLIEGDLRRPSFASRVMNRDATYGVGDVVDGTASLEDSLVTVAESNLSVLFAKRALSNSPQLLESEGFARLIETARNTFDVIVIDAPPLLATSDALALGQVCDSFIYAVRWRTTEKGVVKAGVKSLRDSGCRIAGIVMTRFDTQKGGEVPGYYYENYNRYDKYYTK